MNSAIKTSTATNNNTFFHGMYPSNFLGEKALANTMMAVETVTANLFKGVKNLRRFPSERSS
jgi:hypothetical protein